MGEAVKSLEKASNISIQQNQDIDICDFIDNAVYLNAVKNTVKPV